MLKESGILTCAFNKSKTLILIISKIIWRFVEIMRSMVKDCLAIIKLIVGLKRSEKFDVLFKVKFTKPFETN